MFNIKTFLLHYFCEPISLIYGVFYPKIRRKFPPAMASMSVSE